MRKSKSTSDAASPPVTRRKTRDVADLLHSATEYLIATGQAERALKAGNSAPSFRLPGHDGVEVASETLLRHGPMLVTFYTGLWFPACNRDLQAFESLRPSIEARGASLVGISQQTVAENAKAHAQLKLGFPILSDRGGRVGQLFGVRWRIPELLRDLHRKNDIDLPVFNGDQSWTLPIPSRFIVDRAGLIAFSEINPGQSSRSPPRDALPVLDHLRHPHAA
ncbi:MULTISPECIES: peroxiredoxin-like family protein [unclassified Mesorhizobium]|uniref:peroxiredoxin-like family protein n=1 Tax=unclassified Mesorhizobium TaxID=325217 RepID=UPI00112D4B4D|nr:MULTISPECIES: peroxiredoxin-like family protein [unclassified Mesorhizobium]MBZ9894596.1 AhpC/TSA family protein [Mesorhizobium sp. BR1-1-6]TPM57478.1 AhpC/TSA family protein [Mesorhizobium sp. B2-2-4]TPM65719.1 AhpC/TSA family protein [Mesorhizobium sp. B2-2-1]TPN38372.1 AhpC/TSA family protein [Mesorhizobium sp. B1-1-6]TPN72044.1 AhpC/TSA family protein [Mesorhizobium sp. B1-1-3]